MPYPTKYTRQYDFQSYQVSNPTRPLPGDKVNVDLNAVVTSVDELVEFLKTSIRADGRLANGSVGVNQLDATFNLGFSLPTTWESGVDYTTDSTVLHDNKFWIANVDHTSTDGFDESKWDLIVDFGEQADAAAASATAALASATAASSSASAAASSATNASDSAAAASGSATTATTQASNASDSATAASTSATNAAASATAAGASADAAAASAASITIASQAEAEAGTENTKLMTPLRTAEAIAALAAGGAYGFVTAAQYGVTGDGSTDDAAALQSFVDALEASPYLAGWLIGSAGVFFKLNSSVSIGSNVKIMGCGWNSEIRSTFNGAALKTKGTSSLGRGGIFLSDFSIVGKTAAITGISKANPAVVTCSGGHPFVNGETVRLPNVRGMTEVAGNVYTVAGATGTTFELSGVNSTSYTTYTAGGDVVYSGSIGFDMRYSSGNRLKNLNVRGVQNAYFKYTDSGTVGCYFNVLEDCQAASCEIGDFNYIGANSNNTRGFRTSGVQFPLIDQGNANNCDVHSAEVFETVITANSGSAGSRFNVLRAENPTSTGTVYVINSGVTDAIIVARPYLSSVAGLLSDSGTRTTYYDTALVKAWAIFTQSAGTYTLADSYNIASFSKSSTGIIVVTLKSAMASTTYAVKGFLSQATAATIQEAGSSRTTTTFEIRIQTVASSPAAVDSGFYCEVIGSQ